jgi:hypothetical protein
MRSILKAIQDYCMQNGIVLLTAKTQITDSFAQIFVEKDNTILKLDFVNDIPAHFGKMMQHPDLGVLDSLRNILSNKITSLFRYEPKDIADIWIISKNMSFSWADILDEASEKELGIDSLIAAEIISTFPLDRLNYIKWITHYDYTTIKKELDIIVNDILSGGKNSLFQN